MQSIADELATMRIQSSLPTWVMWESDGMYRARAPPAAAAMLHWLSA